MHKVLSIKKSEEKKVRGQQKNRKQNGALPFQNSGTMNVLSWIDHDNEGDARAETNVASASATLSRPWGMVLSKYMLLPASRINSWSAIMALNLPSRIRPHSLSLWKKGFLQLALQISRYSYVLDTGKIATEGPSCELLNDQKVKYAYLGKRSK